MPTQSDLLNTTNYREEIPALANKMYFNFGGQGTMPRSALKAIVDAYEFVQEEGPFSVSVNKWIDVELESTRQVLAQEFGGRSEGFIVTGSVTEGCNIAMWGLDWQPGDRMLLSDAEHPGVILIAETISRRFSVSIDYFNVTGLSDEAVLEQLRQALVSRPRLVVVSHILWNTGQVLPLQAIGEMCRENGALVLVDAAQSIGVLPLNVERLGVDFYAFTGHKWICGPEGLGCLYASQGGLDKLQPTYVGWRGVGLKDGNSPSRFEVATSPFPLLAGLKKSIEFHQQQAPAAVRYRAICRKTALLRAELQKIKDIEFLVEEQPASSLVAFRMRNNQPADIVKTLESERTYLRTIPKPECIRASIHYFTDDEQIKSLAQRLARFSSM